MAEAVAANVPATTGADDARQTGAIGQCLERAADRVHPALLAVAAMASGVR